MAFLEEWQDDDFSRNFTRFTAFGFFVLTIWLSISTTTLTKEILYYLGGTSLVIFAMTFFEGGVFRTNWVGSKNRLYMGVVAGLILGTVLGLWQRGGAMSIVFPTQSLFLGDMTFLFGNIIAPILEPLFWRGIVFPTALAFMIATIGKKNKAVGVIVAILVASFAFGFFHVNAYYSQTGAFEPTFVNISFASLFGAFFTLGNWFAKTLGLEIGWHFASNLFSLGYPVAQIFPTMIVGLVVFVVIVEVVDRVKLR